MQRSKCLSILNANIDIDHILLIWEKLGLEDAVAAFQHCVNGGNLNDLWPKNTLKQNRAVGDTSTETDLHIEDIEAIAKHIQNLELKGINFDSIDAVF